MFMHSVFRTSPHSVRSSLFSFAFSQSIAFPLDLLRLANPARISLCISSRCTPPRSFHARIHHGNSSNGIWILSSDMLTARWESLPSPPHPPFPASAPPRVTRSRFEESDREFNALACMYRAATSLFFGACFATAPR
ncbi:hypothetical protein SCLCIDRAFT_774594 [Scleroderma citrinum Foug A]|uniref:Uncharacterized protein n=1 Tax=Scleroderma citrinum Foug A TaxID=1036808 RepID=A0A0C3E4X4_9AGAM|nr:hypothetical protein SCLCIDRAFT_774594 [Scleroderma citrinum Foug A]